jgi:hypothetical protein
LPASFIWGFLFDNLTLRRIDFFYSHTVFIWNLFLVGLFIVLFNAHDAGRLRGRLFNKFAAFFPIIIQFAFGNLFSAFVIFYVRGGSIFVSWPFLIPLIILFLGNDFFRKRYLNLTFQMSLYFISLFSYSILILPIIVNKIGDIIFLISSIITLAVISIFLFIISRIIPERFKLNLKPLFCSVGGIFIIFQIFYFTNLIPPLPLSLKESGLYHSLERTYAENYIYKVTVEPPLPYLFFEDQSNIFHWTFGERIYYYSSVFSPTDLDIPIFHRWSYYDATNKKWVEKARLSFPIVGGLDKGYRGYSYILDAFPGKWRVDVINEQGQVLGRRNFTIVQVSEPPKTKTIFR